jgi:saccharopine dehydrogenase-like NADP-dependent oxidoreductase
MWKLEDGEVDITVMKIVIEGKHGGRRVRHTYDMFDRYDAATDTHSMARTTGYAATAAVRMLVAGLYREEGIVPPELVGRVDACVDFMLRMQRERGIVYEHTREDLG